MEARLTMHRLGYVTGAPTDEEKRASMVKDMQANGSPIGDGHDPLFIEAEHVSAVLSDFGIGSMFPWRQVFANESTIIVDVDEWTFRHSCGYASG